ncbi:hypothetical protein BJV78DRAFT_1359772 [Lactifluus subvellereus]|nr:hypothetical protein BJV78DRAFT_1359772 [Lactifluus subvellereus]
MTVDAGERFVGPMPMDLFLSDFVPKAPKKRPKKKFVFAHSSVSQNEDQFIQAIETSGLCPQLKFINTTAQQDGPFRLKPDISIYSGTRSDDHATARSESQKSLNWKAIDLWVENKNHDDDIFRDLEKMKEEEKEDRDLESHIEWTQSSYRICGQLVAYASALHRSQFRVFSFSIVLFGDTGRLLRWDRSGVIYTEPFNWATKHDTLFEFIWRLNFLSDVDRGFDTTVTSAEDDEAEAALSKLRTYQGLENVERTDLHKFIVYDDRTMDESPRSYITPSAIWPTEALFGRSTFGYIAYDLTSTNLVYLKDFWRTDYPGIQKEGDVYRELHNAEVPNIAALGRAGDVPLSPQHANTVPLDAQRTKTQDYLKGGVLGYGWCPGRPRVDPYVHYRLVLETLGQPLNTFRSTRQLCEVIRDAIVAHTVAYEKAGILHRDVSAGNILISGEGSGMLIDWDLSKKVIKDADEPPRQHSRTGTWQFISIERLREPRFRPHQVADDLESFFWVLLYQIAKCRNVRNVDFSKAMQYVFDQHTDLDRDGVVRGGSGKLSCLDGRSFSRLIVYDLIRTPCRAIFEELRLLFRDFYLHVPNETDLSPDAQLMLTADREQDLRVREAREKLRSSEWILAVISRHLASRWDVDDDGSLHKTELRPDPSASRQRRKRKAAGSDDGMTFNQRRKGRLPPSSTKPSRDSRVIQGNRSSFTGAKGQNSAHRRSRSLRSNAPNGTRPSSSSKLRYRDGL